MYIYIYVYVFMCIYIYIYTYYAYIYIYTFIHTYIYIYKHTYIYLSLSIYLYLYLSIYLSIGQPEGSLAWREVFGKGQMGSALMGSLHFFLMFFDRGTVWVPICQNLSTPVNICQFGVPFSQSVKFITFAATPLMLTPFVRNQGLQVVRGRLEHKGPLI